MKHYIQYCCCFLFLVASCANRNYVVSYDQASLKSLELGKRSAIIVGDISIWKTSQSLRYKLFRRLVSNHYMVECIDIGLRDNAFLSALEISKELPFLLILDESGELISQRQVEYDFSLLKGLSYLRQQLPVESRVSNLLKLRKYLMQQDSSGLHSFIKGVPQKEKNAYFYYLLMQLYPMNKGYADSVYSKVFALSKENRTWITSKIMSYQSYDADLLVDTTALSVGVLAKDSTYRKTIPILNRGEQDIVIYNVAVSCNCVNVKMPDVIKPGEYDEMEVIIHTTSELGEHSIMVYVTSNSSNTSKYYKLDYTII